MKILIAIPCMDSIPTPFVQSLMGLTPPEGVEVTVEFHAHSLIYDARNSLAQKAMLKKYDYVLWLDSDMVFNGDILERLLENIEGKDILTGLYFNRRPPHEPCIFKVCDFEEKGELIVPLAEHYTDYPEGMFEIKGCGFGCVLTSTKCLEKVWEVEGIPFSPILGFGEDLSFCIKAVNNGFKIYCDSRIKLGHLSSHIVDEKYSQAYNEVHK